MKMQNYFWLTIILLVIIFANFFLKSDDLQSNLIIGKDSSEIEINYQKTENNQVDTSIENILIYPNQYDKNSIYIDTEIKNLNGEGTLQITLMNNDLLVASSEIFLEKNNNYYFQSFLISENVDFNKDFEIIISALNQEKNISNNRYSFKSNLKIEKPKIAILSGKLNFNTPFIINSINANFSHYYPDPLNKNFDITDFWFNKYDIIILDNFPNKPVSDKWLKLFLKKIYSEKSSLIISLRSDHDLSSVENLLPVVGLKPEDNTELLQRNKFIRFSKDSFKSSFILTDEYYQSTLQIVEEFKKIIDWILVDSEVEYSFFLGNERNTTKDPIFFYGFSNVLDDDIQIFDAKVFNEDILIQELELLYNPISGYYFSQINLNKSGNYIINIMNDFKVVDSININLYD